MMGWAGTATSEANSCGVDVKRIVGFVLLGSALGIVFFVFYFLLSSPDEDPGQVPGWWYGTAYSGVVTRIQPDELTLRDSDNVLHTFRVESTTRKITWGDQNVAEGVEVKVQYKKIRTPSGPVMLARTIRVLRGHLTPSPSGEPSKGAASPKPRLSPSASASASP